MLYAMLSALVLGTASGSAARSGWWGGPFPLGVLSDEWAYSFLALLLVISSSVYVWSYYYMGTEGSYRRFLGILCLFVGSMASLILFATLVGTLIG